MIDLLRPKLENIISGCRINADDADWLRGLLGRAPSAPQGGGEVCGWLDRDGDVWRNWEDIPHSRVADARPLFTAQPRTDAAQQGDGTPSAHWRKRGEPDPHGATYDCERAALAHGNLTDDELANAVFLCDHRNSLDSIGYLTAAKERIRWLSRKLEEARTAPPSAPVGVDEAMVERACAAAAECADAEWPVDYADDDLSECRTVMRAALTAALATQHQEPTT